MSHYTIYSHRLWIRHLKPIHMFSLALLETNLGTIFPHLNQPLIYDLLLVLLSLLRREPGSDGRLDRTSSLLEGGT